MVSANTVNLRVLGVAGSMRAGSRSTLALTKALEVATAAGAETRLLELRTLELPPFRPDQRTTDHPSVVEAVSAVAWADAFILSTPDYHGCMTGVLKNFLDYHWKELCGKLFGTVVSSHEKGLTVTDQLRTVVRQCYGWSLPYGVAVHGDTDFAPDGTITNARTADRLAMLGRDVAVYGKLLINQYRRDRTDGSPSTFARG